MDKKTYIEAIEKFTKTSENKTALIGYDGFVDNIFHVVDKRISKNNYKRIKTIEDFGKRILSAKGKSTNIELVSQKIKMGGNAPLMSNPMFTYGHKINFIGAIGKEKIHPLFEKFAKKCENVISLEDPGYTQALEFNDGKIMLGQMNHLYNVNWENILKNTDEQTLRNFAENSSFFAFTNWTMLPGLNSIIEGISSYFKNMPYIFIDLADPQKRSKKDLKEILYLLKHISYKAKIIFGMNKKESEQIADVLDIDIEDLSTRADYTRNKLNLHTVLLHSLKFAIVSGKNISIYQEAPYEPEPLITTGAGDTLNGGYCAAVLSGLSSQEALTVALFTVGFYVRKGFVPNKQQLLDFAISYFDKL